MNLKESWLERNYDLRFESIVKVYYLFTWIKEKGRKSIKVETKGRKEERERHLKPCWARISME